MIRTAEPPREPAPPAEDERLLAEVEASLRDGEAIYRWWAAQDAAGGPAERFELTRVPNRLATGYSFFGEVPLAGAPGRPLPVMGDVPDLLYDRPKIGPRGTWTREVEEFALRYFMRVSDFAEPEAIPPEHAPPVLPGLSLCPQGFVQRKGFGFEQLYYKLRGSGAVGRFPEAERTAIVDVRELGARYDWVVALVRLFDFDLTYPIDPQLPRVSLPLRETAWVVLSDAFVVRQEAPAPGIAGRYAFGYAMLRRRDERGILAYGPGRFDSGFQLFEFTVADTGEIRVRMPFVVNRPTRLMDVSLDPFQWGLTAAELATFGLARPWLEPLRRVAEAMPWGRLGFDPVFSSVALLNLATLGQASRLYCVSREQLEKLMLIFHFNQYYAMVTGSLLTWRQVPDWLDRAALPEWARSGRIA